LRAAFLMGVGLVSEPERRVGVVFADVPDVSAQHLVLGPFAGPGVFWECGVYATAQWSVDWGVTAAVCGSGDANRLNRESGVQWWTSAVVDATIGGPAMRFRAGGYDSGVRAVPGHIEVGGGAWYVVVGVVNPSGIVGHFGVHVVMKPLRSVRHIEVVDVARVRNVHVLAEGIVEAAWARIAKLGLGVEDSEGSGASA
jgi:hypothetical protein